MSHLSDRKEDAEGYFLIPPSIFTISFFNVFLIKIGSFHWMIYNYIISDLRRKEESAGNYFKRAEQIAMYHA
jgi:hypothetical protein